MVLRTSYVTENNTIRCPDMLYYDIFVFKTHTTSINLCGKSVLLQSQVIHMKKGFFD